MFAIKTLLGWLEHLFTTVSVSNDMRYLRGKSSISNETQMFVGPFVSRRSADDEKSIFFSFWMFKALANILWMQYIIEIDLMMRK